MDLDQERRDFAGELRRPPPLIADPTERAAVTAWLKEVQYHVGPARAWDLMAARVPDDDGVYGDAWVARFIEYAREQRKAGITPLEWVRNESL